MPKEECIPRKNVYGWWCIGTIASQNGRVKGAVTSSARESDLTSTYSKATVYSVVYPTCIITNPWDAVEARILHRHPAVGGSPAVRPCTIAAPVTRWECSAGGRGMVDASPSLSHTCRAVLESRNSRPGATAASTSMCVWGSGTEVSHRIRSESYEALLLLLLLISHHRNVYKPVCRSKHRDVSDVLINDVMYKVEETYFCM